MSYAGPDSRTRAGRSAVRPDADSLTRGSRASAADASPRRPLSRQPLPAPHEDGEGTDWRQVAMFGTGLLVGIAVGAGAALLTAPRTGAETRAVLAASAGRVRRTTSRRGRDAWDDLRDELDRARRTLRRRKTRRALEREMELA